MSAIEIVDLDVREPALVEAISFFEFLDSPQQMKWEYHEATQEESVSERAREFLDRLKRPGRRNHLLWALQGESVVGMVGLHRLEAYEGHCAEIGFGVAASHTRQGVGTRLLLVSIDKARSLDLKRLQADCFADNTAAIALLKRTGFVQEGVKRSAVLKEGRLRDVSLWGLLL